MLDPNQKSKEANEENDTETANTKGPDSTQLARRGALVPPKIDDPMEATDDNADELSQDDLEVACNGDGLIGGQGSPRSYPPRRSSVVVIPPMQVCPGDLLVYSKALTHRGNFPGILISGHLTAGHFTVGYLTKWTLNRNTFHQRKI